MCEEILLLIHVGGSKNLRAGNADADPFIQTLNHRFAVSVFGVKIYSYVESTDTELAVLSTNDLGGETLTTIRLCM